MFLSGNNSNNNTANSFNTDSFNTTNSFNVINNVSNHYAVDERSKILDWLSPLEPHIRHQDVRDNRVADVGDWLLKTDEFRIWRDGNGEDESGNATLFCYGSPGAGKTYISSLVVDTLCDQAGKNTSIACFYFDYVSQKEQSPINVLGSLLKQIVAGLEEIPEKIMRAFTNKGRFLGGRGLQLAQIMELLEIALCSRFTFLCLDALDECIAAHRLKILCSLRQILKKSPNTRIFLTGRSHVRGEVENRLGRAATLFISPRREEICGYLRARLDEDTNPDAMDDRLEADILKKIPETVSEIFLLVSLNIDAILQETTIYRRRKRLGAITNGLGLGDAYGITLERIRAQGGEKARLGMSALMWICYSERPLRVDELCQALAVEVGLPDFNSDNVPPISTLLGCCQGLIIVEKGVSHVRLIHFSLKEYLCTRPDLFVGAQSTMAEICLTYLNSQHINEIPPEFVTGIWKGSFLEYSTLNWGHHAKREFSDCAKSLALKLFGRYGNHISARILLDDQLYDDIFSDLASEPDLVFTGLHCACIFGIVELVSTLIEMEGCDIDGRDSAGFTPLIWASQYGHDRIVELLLAQDNVNPNVSETHFESLTPLLCAAENGHEGVVKLLLARGDVGPEIPDKDGQTPLLIAAGGGHEGVVKLLLAREDVDPDRPDNDGRTPFSKAAGGGHEGVLRLLLTREDVGPERPDKGGRTPFSYAAGGGHEGVLKLLLTRDGVNPDRPDNLGRSPFYYAAFRGRESAVELLLTRDDINIDRRDIYNRTALQGATSRGCNVVARLLRAHRTPTTSTL